MVVDLSPFKDLSKVKDSDGEVDREVPDRVETDTENPSGALMNETPAER